MGVNTFQYFALLLSTMNDDLITDSFCQNNKKSLILFNPLINLHECSKIAIWLKLMHLIVLYNRARNEKILGAVLEKFFDTDPDYLWIFFSKSGSCYFSTYLTFMQNFRKNPSGF